MDSLSDFSSAVYTQGRSTLSWSTRRHSTRSSVLPSLSLVGHTALQIRTLEDVYQTVRSLSVDECSYNDIERHAVVGEGETFLVERCSVKGQAVAVKHLKLNSLATDTPTFFARVRAVLLELRIMRDAHVATHPNIISLLAYGWKQEHSTILPYILVDYSPHGTLRDFMMHNIELSLDQRTRLVLDVAAGLDELHLTGIIHGDVKLDNVLVFDRRGEPQAAKLAKICDFGHSLLLNGDENDLKYRGAPLYNAPEVQRQSSSPISKRFLHKCDIWAFGLLAWETLLSGAVYRDHLIAHQDRASGKEQLATESSGLLDAAISFTLDLVGDFIPRMFFCRLFDKTLQYLPESRTTYLRRDTERQADGQTSILGVYHVLRMPPSLDPEKAAWSSDMFRPEQKKVYSWDRQQRIFQDFQMHLQTITSDFELLGSAAWQLAQCHFSGFGTPINHGRGLELVRLAENYGHTVAILFGSCIRGELEQNNRRQTYVDTTVGAFRAHFQDQDEFTSILDAIKQPPNHFDDYSSMASWLRTTYPLEDKIKATELRLLGSSRIAAPGTLSKTRSILEQAIARSDGDFLRDLWSLPTLKDKGSLGSFLIRACRLGEAAIVRSLLRIEVDVDYIAADGTTFFHWLFMLEEMSMAFIQRNLSYGTFRAIELPCRSVHFVHRQWPLRLQGTPLAFAVSVGNLAAVRLLLALGANPLTPAFGSILDGFQDQVNWTPIHLAVRLYDAEMVELLLESVPPRQSPPYDSIVYALSHHASIEGLAFLGWPYSGALNDTMSVLRKMKKWTRPKPSTISLVQAIHCHDELMVRSLLKRNPRLVRMRITQMEGLTAFTYPAHLAAQEAAIQDSPSSYAVLTAVFDTDQASLKAKDSNGCTPLHIAVTGYSCRVPSWLLKHKPSLLTALDHEGRSALHYCISATNTKLLLNKGAELNLADKNGMTAIHYAAESGATQALHELLISDGCNADVKDRALSTPLHYATSKGFFEATNCLLALGATVDEQDQEGNTPLHLAVRNGRDDIAKLLVEYKSSVMFVKNHQGQVPCHTAILQGNSTLIALLAATATEKDGNGISPLHLCVLSQNTEWMRLLLPSCSLPNASRANFGGRIPLHIRAQAPTPDSAMLSLQKGISAGLKDMQGNNALHVAIKAPESPNLVELCEILHSTGISLTEQDVNGLTPWEIAIQAENFSAMRFLLNNGGVAACPGLIFTDLSLQADFGEKDVGKMSAVYSNGVFVLLRECHRRLFHQAIEKDEDPFQAFLSFGVQGHEKYIIEDYLDERERLQAWDILPALNEFPIELPSCDIYEDRPISQHEYYVALRYSDNISSSRPQSPSQRPQTFHPDGYRISYWRPQIQIHQPLDKTLDDYERSYFGL